MRLTWLALLATVLPLTARPYLTEPSLSPDRSEIVFVSGGDIWTVPTAGGTARLLVSDPATESRPLYSPDGKRLAFVSTRTGSGDIYVLTLATGELKRLTFSDALDQLDNWSRDGKYLYFSTTANDIAGMNDIYRVSVEGGTPMPVSADRYANEFGSAPSPDGITLAFAARGVSSNQWWRKGHSHLDESEIYLKKGAAYERLSDGQAKDMWPMWSADGKRLFYMSDRSGAENIWQRPVGGQPKQLTKFKDGRLLWPSISYDGKLIVFERNFGIWKCDTSSGEASAVEAHLIGTPAGPSTTHLSLTTGFRDLALSPDGKKVAFIAHGEVFAASSKDGGSAARITQTPANESHLVWSPDNHRVVYVSDRDGVEHLYQYDLRTNTESQLTKGKQPDYDAAWSPDGKRLAYLHAGRELHVFDPANGSDKAIATAHFDLPPERNDRIFGWSPDSRWIAYITPDSRQFTNVEVVPTEGGKAQKISFLANSNSDAISWSPDGTYMLFNTSQRTETVKVARIDLIPRTPRFREDQFQDLFKEDAPKTPKPSNSEDALKDEKKPDAKKPVNIVFEGIRQRLSLLPTGVNTFSQTISPDGKTLLITAEAAGQVNLYTYTLDELGKEPAVARQLTSTPGRKSDAQWSPDGKEVFYLEGGHINSITVENRQTKPLAVTAELDVNFDEEKREVFRQAWSYLNDNFYDSKFGGADWLGLREQYTPMVESAKTPDEVRRIISLMIGELNASHSGIGTPFAGVQGGTGRLGLRFDRDEYEKTGHLKVTEVITLSPAALGAIKVGDLLAAVDGHAVDGKINLDELLQYKVDRRVMLTVQSGTEKRDVPVRPVNTVTEKRLLYRQWVEHNRDYVSRMSNGRLGYVHMSDMSSDSLDQLFLDLDAENHSRKGVVVDVRNNNGGFVNAYALDVLTRKGYLNMTSRDEETAPARSILGQRSLERPTVLVVNQHSLSDAEDFTEGYRTLKLGKVVGEPTAGWIIFTGGTQLIDGSTLRLPRTRITANDGSNMEGHPRPVDVEVLRPIGESYTGRDAQLDAAVRVLLEAMPGGTGN